MKKLRFRIEAIIGDRYESTDSFTENEIHEWLLNMQKQDILKVETEKNYWEDVGQNARTIEINEGMGEAIYRLSKSPIENSMSGNREHIRRKSFSEKLWEEINCNN